MSPLSLSPFPHPLMLRVFIYKMRQLDPVLFKVPDSYSYSYLASWDFPPHFHIITLGKGHFFALKSVHWEPALCLSHTLSLKRPYRNTGNVVSDFIWDRGNCRPNMSNATWKMTPSPGWCIFSTFWWTSLLQFYFIKLPYLEEIFCKREEERPHSFTKWVLCFHL